jgi:hypothetical protein
MIAKIKKRSSLTALLRKARTNEAIRGTHVD